MLHPNPTVMLLMTLVEGCAILLFSRAPRCVQCSSKFRHRTDCPHRR